jgi:hypothetical protein
MPSLQFRKKAPSLVLAVDMMTNQRMTHRVKNAPLSLIETPSLVSHPMKKCPHALLWASDSDKY